MKIAILSPGLPNKGGAARFTWEFSEYLSAQNDDVTIISLYTRRNIFIEKNNLKIIDLADKDSTAQSVKFWFNLQKTRKRVKCLINELNPDVVVVMNFPATLWTQKFGEIPILCYPHDINLLYTNTYIKNLSIPKYLAWLFIRIFVRSVDKKKWKYFDEVICNSKYSEKLIRTKYNVSTKIIHAGTRTKFFQPYGNKKKAVLCIASHRTQRCDFLLKSISKLLNSRKDFEIWIIGDHGAYQKELQNIVKLYNIKQRVKFFGIVTDEKLIQLYSEACVTVHLVRQPPFGLIVTESMSCGTPVIGCIPGGTQETIQHEETGFWINENDSEKLVEYIELMINNPEKSISMGIQARKKIEANFDMDKKSFEFRNLILNWVNKKSKA